MTTYLLTETVFSAFDSLQAGTRVEVEGALPNGGGYVDVIEAVPPHRMIAKVSTAKLRAPAPLVEPRYVRSDPLGGWC